MLVQMERECPKRSSQVHPQQVQQERRPMEQLQQASLSADLKKSEKEA